MRNLLPFCVAFTLAAAGDWDRKPAAEWNQGQAFRVLTDSPWAKKQSVKLTWKQREYESFTYKDVPAASRTPANPGLGPLGGIGPGKAKFPLSADVIFRWASALPVRQATAVFKLHDGNLPPAKLNSLIPQPEPDYVIELFGVPVELAHAGANTLESLAKGSIALTTAGGRTLTPNKAVVTLQGDTLSLRVHFPRDPAIEFTDRELECSGDLQIFSFRVRFKLSAMQFQNRLEL